MAESPQQLMIRIDSQQFADSTSIIPADFAECALMDCKAMFWKRVLKVCVVVSLVALILAALVSIFTPTRSH